jgi:Ca2+ transporting ATPase
MDDTDFTKVFMFNSAMKRMSTVIPLPEGGFRLLTKGAAEVVIKRCTGAMDMNGEVGQLNISDQDMIIKEVIEKMAAESLRTICVAYKDYEGSMAWEMVEEEEVTSDLTMLCIVGIEDPVREEVRKCK